MLAEVACIYHITQSFSTPIINWFSCPQEVVKQVELVKEVMLSRKLSHRTLKMRLVM